MADLSDLLGDDSKETKSPIVSKGGLLGSIQRNKDRLFKEQQQKPSFLTSTSVIIEDKVNIISS